MRELILHHYATSPFSEKVRLILGFKGLAWRSVTVPAIMPKPDVIALTGGYRKTPFLQIGADIYCDTALVARALDELHPQPPLYPAGIAGTAQILSQWADHFLFWTAAIPYTMQPAGVAAIFADMPPQALKAFAADRGPFTATMVRQTPADATAALHTYLGWLQAHVADGREFLCGMHASIADFSVAQCLWYVRRVPELAKILDGYSSIDAWLMRVRGFGNGESRPMTSAESIEVAARAKEHAPTQVEPGLGFAAGDLVTVMATDYGRDPVPGKLVGLSRNEVVIERKDERAGTLQVHFPRLGFQVKQQEQAT